ncbi:hypothetical protein B6U93_00125 [Candidatus Woesearchaeota archaeon ex4484_78]|nr:MAG: hypothetical protein B6U93_00125 [Candidatus Woesearchaeota archaeon ex4484_78]
MELNIEKILNEVERERRRKLVIELYKKGLESEIELIREGTAYMLDGLAIADENLFEEFLSKGLEIELCENHLFPLSKTEEVLLIEKQQFKELIKNLLEERRKNLEKEIQSMSENETEEEPENEKLQLFSLFYELSRFNPKEFLEEYKSILDRSSEKKSNQTEKFIAAASLSFLAETINEPRLIPNKDEEYDDLEKYVEMKLRDLELFINDVPEKTKGKLDFLKEKIRRKKFFIFLECHDKELSAVLRKKAKETLLDKEGSIEIKSTKTSFKMYKESNNSTMLKDFYKEFCEQALQPYFLKKYQEAQQIKIDGYKIIGKIGQGASKKVYWAKKGKENVALSLYNLNERMIKILKDKGLTIRDIMEKDLKTSPFRISHNNICYFELNKDFRTGQEFGVSELLDGTLERLMRTDFPQKEIDTLRIDVIKQIIEGLSYVHELGIIHSDLKPENILFKKLPSGKYILKIADFGLSQTLENLENEEESLVSMGHIAIRAPELHEPNHSRGPENDVWSFGCLIYWLWMKKEPFLPSNMDKPDKPGKEREEYEKISYNLKQDETYKKSLLKSLKREMHSSLIKIVEKCWEVNPKKRYKNAVELKKDLETVFKEYETGSHEA